MRKIYKKTIIFIATLIILLASSCDSNNPEGIPSYIQVDTAYFNANFPNIQGSSSSKIVDVWVYIDNQIQGIYEMPAIFPVLKSGETDIYFRAGILMDGMLDSRIYYPFYERYTPERVKLTRGEITKIEPTFTYISPELMTFAWIEDFENFSSSLKATNNSTTNISIAAGSDAYEGNFSGKIVLENTNTYFEIKSSDKFYNIPYDDSPVYIEFDYKVDTIMTIGIEAIYESSTSQSARIVSVNAKDKWTKIYVNIKTEIQDFYDADYYNIFFIGGFISSDSTATIDRKEFLIDNIKLVY